MNVLALGPLRTWFDEKGLTKDDFTYKRIRKKDLR